MKKINKLKLNQLSKKELEIKQMNLLRGGDGSCGCSCTCECTANCSCPPVSPGEFSTEHSNFDAFSIMLVEGGKDVNLSADSSIQQVYAG